MRVCLIDIDALSDRRSPALPECGAHPTALLLWPALKQFYALIPYTRGDGDVLTYWLDREGFVGAIKQHVVIDGLSESIQQLRSLGNDIELLVTPSIIDLQGAYDNGVQALLTVTPSYEREEWVPGVDRTPREWSYIADIVAEKRVKLAEDKRKEAIN